MDNGIRCFLVNPTEYIDIYNRRYKSSSDDCPDHGYHHAKVFRERAKAKDVLELLRPDPAEDCWGLSCSCGYKFTDKDVYQLFKEIVYTDSEGTEYHLRGLPPGAMYYAEWMEGSPRCSGPDGKALFVVTPGGVWSPDSRAKNCTKPNDNDHKCWIRHGSPPHVTVDKNGVTCGAGGGSIGQKNYHGFLRNGFLVTA